MQHIVKAFIIIIFLTSCFRETILDEEMPEFNSELTIISVLTPVDSIFVQLQETVPYSGKVIEYNAWNIKDAFIELSDNSGNSMNLPLVNKQKGLFGISQNYFPIRAGETYHITVSTPDGRSLRAKTTIPSQKAVFDSIYIQSDKSVDTTNDIENRIKITGRWHFPQDKKAYYIVRTIHHDSIINLETNDAVTTSYQEMVTGDIMRIGNYYEYSYSTTINKSNYYPPQSIHTYQVDLLLITLNQTLADYIHIYEQNEIKEQESTFRDALFSFQGIVSSSGSIDGGKGLFGGYLIYKATLNF